MISDTPLRTKQKMPARQGLFPRAFTKLADLEKDRALQLLLLAAITSLALVMRFYKLGQWSFWVDEIFSIENSQKIFSQIVAQPIGLYSLTKILIGIAIRLFGVGEWSSRLMPAIMGVVSVPILYLPIRRMFDSTTALISLLLLVLSPWHLYWSQNARFYTSMMLFYCLALFTFFLGLQEQRRRYMLLSIVFLIVAMGERLSALFLVPVVLVYLALIWILPYEKPSGFKIKNLIPFIVLLGLGALFVVFDLYQYATGDYSFIYTKFEWFFATIIDDPFRLVLFTLYNIGLPLATLALFGGVYLITQRSPQGLYLLIGILTPVILLAVLTPFMFTQDRYVFVTLPLWTTLAAVVVKRIFDWGQGNGKLLALAVLSILVVDALWGNLMYFTVNNGNRYDWRGMFTRVDQMKHADDVVVSTYIDLGEYYMQEPVVRYIGLKPESVEESGQRHWFVLDSNKAWANPILKSWLEKNGELVDEWYLRVPEALNLRIYLYDPANPPAWSQ